MAVQCDWTERADVLIDFSAPAGLLARLPEAVKMGAGVLVGTTGLTDHEKIELAHAGRSTPTDIAPNMSVGVNMLFRLVG